jgi:Zn-dependent membrane protease YugP
MFIGFDPLYLLLVTPAMLLAAWASYRVHSAFAMGQQYRAASGLTGAEAAAAVMQAAGVTGVDIEETSGFLSDHYDPSAKVLRLSPDVFHGQNLSALGVAAHEAGHAVQDATHYPLLVLRNGLVPLASIGGNLSWIFIMIGLVLMYARFAFGPIALYIGIGLFSLTVLFQLINLPVEFDASRRARDMLLNHALVTEDEDRIVKKVLGAAAMTYVAGTITAAMQLLYFLIRAGLLGGRSND